MNQNTREMDVFKDGISLFFPAYNEESNIGTTIEKSIESLEPLGCKYEIIIVDDGSKDKTSDIVNSYTQKNANVILKRHEKNQGYGAALQTGFRSCKNGLIFFSDSDLQFDLKELTKLIEVMQKNPSVDAVIGYRIKRADNFMRKLNAFGWKMWARIIFGLKVKDIDCAFKLFKRKLFDYIQIESTGALISLELLTKIRKMGGKIEEVGVHHYPRHAGKQTGAKIKVIIRAFYESFKLYNRIKKFSKEYKASTANKQS